MCEHIWNQQKNFNSMYCTAGTKNNVYLVQYIIILGSSRVDKFIQSFYKDNTQGLNLFFK